MISVEGFDELNKAIVDNKDSLILLYFGASWCGPCMMLKEKIETNKEEIKNLVVLYVDCDSSDNEEIVEQYNVSALPTQIFVHLDNDKVVKDDKIEGYDWIQLVMKYNDLNNRN